MRAKDWIGYWDVKTLTIKGVIDQNFATIVPFKAYYEEIQIFPGGNIILTERFSGGDGEQSYTRYDNTHYRIVNGTLQKVRNLESSRYLKINETTIQIRNNPFYSGFEALYDVVQGKIISERFTTIGGFEQHGEENLAQAIIRLPYPETDNVWEVICYIDADGMIRTPLYNSYSNCLIDTTDKSFQLANTIDGIKKQIAKDTGDRAQVVKELIKTVQPKKH